MKRPACTDDFATFITRTGFQSTQGPELLFRNFIEMLQGLAAKGEQRTPERPQRFDQFSPISHFAPVISGLRLPGRPSQGPAGNAG
ncbi:hypothetical protein D9M71_595180 [compost metagenome]